MEKETRGSRGRRAAAILAGMLVGCSAATVPLGEIAPPDLDAGAVLESMAAHVGKDPGDVTLRFAWPLPLEGRCATMARRIERAGVEVVRTTFEVQASREGDQIRVDTVDVAVPADAAAAILPLAETWTAERLVDAQGRLLRAQPLDPGLGAAERSAITARLAQRWQSLVSAWAGRSLPLDATYSATAPEQTAEGPVRLQIAIRADGWVPCDPGATAHDCVRLRILSQPVPGDAAKVARLIARERMSPEAFALYDDNRVRAFATQTTVVLITDPKTLVPRRLAERRMVQLRVDSLLGDDAIDLNRQDDVTTACRWRS